MNRRRLTAFVLSCALVASTPVYAREYQTKVNDPANYRDIKGHWAEEALTNALANGIMEGTSESTASPNAPLTRAEMATLIVRAFEATKTSSVSMFVDMKSDDWFYDYLQKAVQMGIVNGNGNAMNPNARISRQEAALVLTRAFNLYGYSASIAGCPDYGSLAPYAREAMSACIGAKVMNLNEGRIEPTRELTRAEFTNAIYTLVQYYTTSKVPYVGGVINGSLMVTTPGVVLSNSQVTGNMYLGDGVDTSSITLDNYTVSGTIYVRGGSQLILQNGSKAGSVVVVNPSTPVSIEADETSSIGNVVLDDDVKSVSLTGKVGNVTMNTAKAELKLIGARADNLSANVVMPTVSIDADSTVYSMSVSGIAEGATVNVDGHVTSLGVDAPQSDVTIGANADINSMSINCGSSKFRLGGRIRTLTLRDNARNNDIEFTNDCEVNSFDINAASSNDITVQSNANMSELVFNREKIKTQMVLRADKARIGNKANDSTHIYNSGTSLNELYVDGDGVMVEVKKGARISTIYIHGDNVDIIGEGDVGKVIAKSGSRNADISTRNTNVENDSGSTIRVGGTRIAPGEKASTDGDGDYKPDPAEEARRKQEEEERRRQEEKEESEKTYQSTFSLSFPVNATQLDLYYTGAYSLSSFVLSGGYDRATGHLKGKLQPIEGFVNGVEGYKYYFPLLLHSSDRTENFTLTVGDKTYTRADLSLGPNYKNQLIFFVPINPYDSVTTLKVFYDADGSNEKYYDNAVLIDTRSLQFETHDVEPAERAASLRTADGIDAIGFTGKSSTEFSYNLFSNTEYEVDAAEHSFRVYVPAPESARKAAWDSILNGTTTHSEYDVETDEEGKPFLIYTHTYTKPEDFSLEVQWISATGSNIGSKEVYSFNTSGIEVPKEPEPAGNTVADSITVTKYPSDALLKDTGHMIGYYCSGYQILDSSGETDDGAVAGTYNIIDGEVYIPISITVWNLKADAELVCNDVSLGTFTYVDKGEETYNPSTTVLIPARYIGAQMQDFDIELFGDGYSLLTKHMNCEQAAVYQEYK